MATQNSRKFTVTGNIECAFAPNETTSYESIENLDVELWNKSPLDVYFLGSGKTDTNGDYEINFTILNQPPYLQDGKIENVFIKVYYKGQLISGGNPYDDNDRDLRIVVPYETSDNSASITIVPNSTGTIDNVYAAVTNLTIEKNSASVSPPFSVDVDDVIDFYFDSATEDGNIVMEGDY
tara:strand:- start:90 stop:629 length:540 start_codon:yes stop_codon:yes gene_type:complete